MLQAWVEIASKRRGIDGTNNLSTLATLPSLPDGADLKPQPSVSGPLVVHKSGNYVE